MTDLRAAARALVKYDDDTCGTGHHFDEFIATLRAALDAPEGEAVAVVDSLTTAQLSVIGDPQVGTKLYTHASPQPSESAEIQRLRDGLQWYADENHIVGLGQDWELEEGWLCPPNDEPWMVEPGGVAKAILDGATMNPDVDDDAIVLPSTAERGRAVSEWQLVPKEPDDNMLSVKVNIDTPLGTTAIDAIGLSKVWEAMLEIAPSRGEQAERRSGKIWSQFGTPADRRQSQRPAPQDSSQEDSVHSGQSAGPADAGLPTHEPEK